MASVIFFMIASFTFVSCRDGFGPYDQEWGYIAVKPGAEIFWWLYKTNTTKGNITNVPLLIWLQGGPGSSATGYGNFAEIGPLDVDLKPRNSTWIRNYHVLFVDSPVGSGFSYANDSRYFATTNQEIADDFLVFLKGFYRELPIFQRNPLYIFSESYGGKMAVDIALVLDQAIKNGSIDANFKGIALGDAWISPVQSVLNWGPFLYNFGAVDLNGLQLINSSAANLLQAINNGNYSSARELYHQTQRTARTVAKIDFYNILKKVPYSDSLFFANMDMVKINETMNNDVKNKLGLKYVWSEQIFSVYDHLSEDFLKPVTDRVELLLNTTDVKVAIYNGQYDLMVTTPSTLQWIGQLKWPGRTEWMNATRRPIAIDGFYEGFVKKTEKFVVYWVNRAGHMVPVDNTAAMDYILEDFTARN